MKLFRFILLIWLPLFSYSQEFQVQNISDEKEFPQIKLKVNIRNPKPKTQDDFLIIENSIAVDFSLNEVKNSKPVSQTHNLLILVENLNHKDRNIFYKTVLKNAISQLDLNHYNINIAVFDRVREKGTKAVFFLLPQYTNDKTKIVQAIQEIKPKNDIFGNNKSSDLYLALYEASQKINNSFTNNKNIIVLSTAFNNKWSSHTSTESVKAYAKTNNIAMYSIQFRIQGYEHHRLTDLTIDTYGNEVITDNTKQASQALSTFIKNIPNKYGKEYFLSYITTHKQDGRSYTSFLSVSNKEKPFTVKTKNKYLLLYYILSGIIFMLFSVLLFFYIKKKNLNNQKEIDRLEHKIQDESEKNLTLQQNVIKQKDELKQIKDIESRKAQEDKKKRLEKTLFEQMKKLGSLPEIHFFKTDKYNRKVLQAFIINKSQITIGRSPDNDLILTDPSVSRLHALIIFKNNTYYLKNKSTSVGTKINKEIIKEKEIKHGNIIQLGKIELTFIQ